MTENHVMTLIFSVVGGLALGWGIATTNASVVACALACHVLANQHREADREYAVNIDTIEVTTIKENNK
jgi:TRAP-type uncharacterized transport system fused permease subunit